MTIVVQPRRRDVAGDEEHRPGTAVSEVPLDDGTVWRNMVTPSKAKVAETLDESRGNHLYNRLDAHYRRFAAQCGQVAMWDDHEVRDNWYHAQVLPEQSPYTEKRVGVLAARARQAFLEQYPVTIARGADALIYRSIPFGPLVEVFALDMRSHRAANSGNTQDSLGADSAKKIAEGYSNMVPLKDYARPEDVADAIVWLIEGARQVTGETIYIDGGMHITPPR